MLRERFWLISAAYRDPGTAKAQAAFWRRRTFKKTDRFCRSGIPVAEALEELQRCVGTQFDADVVRELCHLAATVSSTAQVA